MSPADPVSGLAERIAAELGLDFSADRRLRLHAALAQAEHAGYRPDGSLDALLPFLVVGETYFLRDPDTLAALRRELLLPLLAVREAAGERRLRLWSAACCTGEEAWTLLFLLDELLGPALPDWRIEFLATDLNPAYIEHASAGRYGDYAFRQADPAWRDRYFAAEGKDWRLRPQWRGRIRFAVHNLAQDDYGVAGDDPAGYDLIVCRNVLMYLTPAVVRHSLRQLQARLAADGRLLLAAAESGLAAAAGFEGRLLGLGYAIDARPPAVADDAGAEPAAPVPSPPPPREAARGRRPKTPQRPPARPLPAVAPAEADPATPDAAAPAAAAQRLAEARRCADRGELGRAREACGEAIRLAPLQRDGYWLLALVEVAADRHAAALQVLQKLAYLEPDLIMAAYLAAQLRFRLGQAREAERERAHCLRLLDGCADDAVLPLGDGLGVVQLRQLCLALGETRP
ncbi:CheR family methyltransferase [Chitinimonas koreensis]|uniref:CheR family methyltransferase n=1 Tax=Chitinimonas koreensis TaxID=356302 RepID=UPI00146F97BF|nr:CheR family methyltransferase [Chitinimonas koreensis]QNM97539.1 chemotaxis protein CheR [Chitinimonas koreensis]